MAMSNHHSHYQNGGLPGYSGMMGHMHLHMNQGIVGDNHDCQDDLDLDSLVNGLSSFPTPLDSDDQHLLSQDDLNESSDYEPSDHSSSPPIHSHSPLVHSPTTYSNSHGPLLQSVSSPTQVVRFHRQHKSLIKSKSLPIRQGMKSDIPDPFPDLGGYQQTRIATSMLYKRHYINIETGFKTTVTGRLSWIISTEKAVELSIMPTCSAFVNFRCEATKRKIMESKFLSENNCALRRTLSAGRKRRNGQEECFFRNQDNKKDQETLPSENSVPVKVYCEDGSWKVSTVIVEPMHSAMDVCRIMVMQKNTVEDKNWSLVEHLTDQGLERILEDHEKVLEVYNNWPKSSNNKIYFRKNFRKYEIFQNPCQFFPMHMLELTEELEGLSEKAERTKQILLQNLFLKGDKLPKIQGFLHSHDGHKKSWKKHYFFLRQSGLYYSTKGTSKDPKHLTCYVQFDHIELHYAINGKKQYHSPSEFVFTLRPTKSHELKEVKYFCAEDEQSRQCWLAGMRLIANGKQLSENYKQARKFQALGREMDLETSSRRIENSNDRVAIDFSGHSGRIIGNKSEAIAIAEREGVEWSRRSGRPVESPRNSPRHGCGSPRFIASSPRQVISSPRSNTSPRLNCMSSGSPRYTTLHNGYSPIMKRRLHTGIHAGIHATQPWYHSGISRDETHGLFAKQGMVDGLFLIRESQRLPGTYVLSFSQNQKVKHYPIQLMEDDNVHFVSLDEGVTKFCDLVQLVDFYKMNAGGLPTRLLHICTKL
ncbi:growth factor receptor-bound protein 14-like isoform X1 [Antedon mediterranea]|uniref:growth factor receptor-bound protein 14-like isoform X1 n=1 Tax=Antedon mediterranea TaxID=105859 RepID=UPI003AF4E4F4